MGETLYYICICSEADGSEYERKRTHMELNYLPESLSWQGLIRAVSWWSALMLG